MHFPSLQSLSQSIKHVLKRFPFEILFACIGTLAAIAYVELDYIDSLAQNWCMRIIMTANLGLLISLSTTLFLERRDKNQSQLLILKLAAALLAGSLVFLINPLENNTDLIRFFLLSLASHLLVSFAAFINYGSIQGFWQFNKTLFLRFATSILYSTVLYLGLAAAIGAMNFLFGFDFNSDTYLILWICIAGLFNTIFFLAGIPEDTKALDQDFSYPKGLKIFTQYVLIPLATIYLIILLAYETKILIQWSLPKGLVSSLILSYAVFGILSLLLVFPIREHEENKWIKTYAKSFYFLMLPLLILLFLAVGNRVFHYGITEYRYFLIVLAFWLLFVSIYFLFSKRQNIKIIPISLCILTLLSIHGPQSASSVSCYSQKRILIAIFKRNHSFENGKLITVKKMPKKDAGRAYDIVDFLVRRYDLDIFQPYVKLDLDRIKDSIENVKSTFNNRYEIPYEKTKWITRYLGLKESDRWINTSAPDTVYKSYSLISLQNDILAVKGYDFILQQNDNFSVQQDTSYNSKQENTIDQIHTRKIMRNDGIVMLLIEKDSATFDLKTLTTNLVKDPSKLKAFLDDTNNGYQHIYNLPSQMLSITRKTKNFTISYHINLIHFNKSDHKTYSIISLNGTFLIKKNK